MKVMLLLIAGMATAGVAGASYYYDQIAQDPALSTQLAWHASWCAAFTLVLAVFWRDAFRTMGDRLTLILILLVVVSPLAGLWYLGLLHP